MFLRIALSSLMFWLAAPASAQVGPDDERAANHFHAATGYFEEERFEEALPEFQEAYRLSERPQLLYNIGLCFERLGRWSEAADAHARFIEAAPNDPNVDAARERMERAEARAEAATATDAAAEPDVASDDEPSLVPWVILGASAAVGVVSLITGLVAHGISNDLANTCTDGVCPPDKQDDASRGEALALTSTILMFAAAAGAATSLVLFLLAGGEDEESQASARVEVLPVPEGALVSGRLSF